MSVMLEDDCLLTTPGCLEGRPFGGLLGDGCDREYEVEVEVG